MDEILTGGIRENWFDLLQNVFNIQRIVTFIFAIKRYRLNRNPSSSDARVVRVLDPKYLVD
jgi:hypothetical protein